jgi:acyl carrier protein
MTNQPSEQPLETFPLVMSRLYGKSEDQRIAAIPEILKHGQIGKDLVIKIIETETGAIQEVAIHSILSFLQEKCEQLNIEINVENKELEAVSQRLDEESKKLEEEWKNLQDRIQILSEKRDRLNNYRQVEETKEREQISKRISNKIKSRDAIETEIENLSLQVGIERFNAIRIKQIEKAKARRLKEIEESQARRLKEIEEFNFRRIKRIIIEQLEVESEKVILEANLAIDLDATELDKVELIMGLEEEFNVQIPISDADVYFELNTVKDLFDCLNKTINSSLS